MSKKRRFQDTAAGPTQFLFFWLLLQKDTQDEHFGLLVKRQHLALDVLVVAGRAGHGAPDRETVLNQTSHFNYSRNLGTRRRQQTFFFANLF